MDNRSHEEAEWDFDLLGPELLELQDMAVDLSLTGFDEDEITGFLATLDATTEGLTDDDDCPEPPANPVTVLGDVWLLGRHRLMCGDSTNLDMVARLMAGEKADLCITDPPYGVSYVGKTKDKLKILNDSMSDVAFAQFLADAYVSLATAVKDGAAVYVFHADTFGHHFRQEFINAGFHLSGVCIWKKQTIVMGRSDFHWKHEPILYGWKEGHAHGWYGDRKQSTIWEFDRPTKSTDHPTTKPVALLEYPISLSSKSGDVVLDIFGGSGSTLIACEKTGRNARLMELDPRYCDVIISRWQSFVGKTATLASDGRSFAEIKNERVPVEPGKDATKDEVLA
jgi:DNA modification methylase